MNKKKLSVVMAGAMLATSVAPVLAAPVEYGTSQKKLVAKEINDLVESGKITNNTILANAEFTATALHSLMDGKYSIYGIKVLNEKGKEVDLHDIVSSISASTKETFKISEIASVLADENNKLVDGYTIQVVEKGNSKFLGQIIPGSEIKGLGVAAEDKFKAADFATISAFSSAAKLDLDTDGTEKTNKFIKSVSLDTEKATATITLAAFKNLSNEKDGNITIDVKVGDDKIDFRLPLDKDGNLINTLLTDDKKVQDCVGFPKKETYQPSAEIKSEPTLKAEYKLVDDSKKHEEVTYLANELYDGLALTAKGTEIQTDINNAKEVAKENDRVGKETVVLSSRPSALANGFASFTVTYYDSYKDLTATGKVKEVTVKSTSLKEIQSLYDMLTSGDYTVGIIGGDNRYETAVNVAKKQGITKLDKDATVNNIVLVNGRSLVDGLAAAPLAANLGAYQANKGGSVDAKKSSPLLLSEADSLPKATKDYLVELTKEISPEGLKKVKINLVGGETVLSESLVKELKGMGFSVERFGGDNREETSLEVSRELVASGTGTRVFVVGANGEADAMSIASVASQKSSQTPIVVAKAGGISKNAVRFIENNYDGKTDEVVIIGGESVVSKEEYEKIDSVVENKVTRIAGKNRFETNAAIIDKYASNIEEVVLVKDGQSNKEELVDALSAANFAAGNPILLATDKITDAQKTAVLNKKHTSKPFAKLTQVGQGVSRPTLEAVAEFLGLSNVK